MESIKIMKKTLIDEFEVDGKWFRPNDSERSFHGKLLFSHTDTILHLFGSLTQTEQDPLGLHQLDDLNIIFGYTLEGELVTLFNVYQTSNQVRFGGHPSQSYKFDFFVVGGHFSSLEELNFDEVSFRSTYLESFICDPAFTFEFEHEENILKQATASYAHPEIQEWQISNIGAQLKTTSHMQMNRTSNGVDMQYKALMKLVPNTQQNYNWFLPKLYKLLSLFSIFTEKEQFFKELSFKVFGETPVQNKVYKVFFIQKDFIEISELNSIENIILPEIRENFGSHVNNWFQLYSELESIYNLYLNTKFNGVYEEWKFLNYTRILEGYHRLRYTDSTYCNPSEYESIKEGLHTYLDETLIDASMQQLKGNIKGATAFAYEYPFAKRLSEIGRNIERAIFNKIFRSYRELDSFMYKVKETRNKMTHPQVENQNILRDERLFLANVRLNALIHSLILIDLGFPPKFIERKIPHLHSFLITAMEEFN
ncbi:hypothetical protein COK80_22870 [Bacillus anthracis]|nr:hypothetical protein COK80_22870 [Bacillus anthracis]